MTLYFTLQRLSFSWETRHIQKLRLLRFYWQLLLQLRKRVISFLLQLLNSGDYGSSNTDLSYTDAASAEGLAGGIVAVVVIIPILVVAIIVCDHYAVYRETEKNDAESIITGRHGHH